MPEDRDRPERPIELIDIDNSPDFVENKVGPPDYKKLYDEYFEKFTQVSNEKFKLREDMVELREEAHTSQALDRLISPYASKAFWFMAAYSAVVGLFVAKDAMHQDGFHIDADVLKILIGSTAANVIGLVGMVLTGVFVGARKRK